MLRESDLPLLVDIENEAVHWSTLYLSNLLVDIGSIKYSFLAFEEREER